MFCARGVGFNIGEVNSYIHETRSMFKVFAAIFCFPCINFQYSSVLKRKQVIQWNANSVGQSLWYPSDTWGDIVFPQNKWLITDSITQETVNSFHNACFLGAKRIFRTYLPRLFGGNVFMQTSLISRNNTEQHRRVSSSFFNPLRKHRCL